MKHYLAGLTLFFAAICLVQPVPTTEAQDVPKLPLVKDDAPKPMPKPPVHPRGRKVDPAVVKSHHEEAFKRHGHKMRALPNCALAAFDCKDVFGNVLPTDDQGQCGDCFGVSSADACSMALVKAKVLPFDTSKGRLSSQYGLDSEAFQGGCNGGDEAQVIDYIKNTGFPLTSDYGTYSASPGNPKSGLKMYKIKDWGYCTPSQQQGVASTQDIKNAMAIYGPISVAFDASECNGYNGGTMTGSGQSVDHAVICEGFDDNHDNGDGSKGAFIGRNQWGQADSSTVSFQSQPWGITINGVSGRFWIKYGADSWGTEAIWIDGGAAPVQGLAVVMPATLTAMAGTPIALTPVATGGTSPISFSFSYGDGQTGSTQTHTYATAGNYMVITTATDSSAPSNIGTATTVITVALTPPIPPTPTGLGDDEYAIDPIAKTIRAGKNWKLPNTVSVEGVSDGIVKIINELIAVERIKKPAVEMRKLP